MQLALSASTPIVRGYLSNMDCRWGILSSAMDDRTPEEKGLEVSPATLAKSLNQYETREI